MERHKLDSKTVRTLVLDKDRDEDFVWDTELKGFGVRLRRRNDGHLIRTWAVQYRCNGRQRRISLKSLEIVSPARARKKAKDILAKARLGEDEQAERQAKRREATQTFRAVVTDYLADRERKLRPKTFRMAKLYLTGGYFKSLHAMGIGTVNRSDVAACTRAIGRKHGDPTARIARQHLSAFFGWAIAEGLLGDGANPVDGSYQPAESAPRDRVLSDTELVAVWKACGDDEFGRIIRLLVTTGARRQEIGGMKWDEFDPVGNWTLPAARSKNKRAHVIALPPAAFDILAAVTRRADRDHLFGDRSACGFVRWADGKRSLDRRLGKMAAPWRVHDIRRTVATRMADIGVEPHVIEAVLNHYSGHRAGNAGVYNRAKYERQVREALVRWSEHVLTLVEDGPRRIAAGGRIVGHAASEIWQEQSRV